MREILPFSIEKPYGKLLTVLFLLCSHNTIHLYMSDIIESVMKKIRLILSLTMKIRIVDISDENKSD